MAKWPFAALAAVSTVAWLAIPAGMLPAHKSGPDTTDSAATRSRLAALARARVFLPGHEPAARPLPDVLSCRFVGRPVSGTTPKFDCTLDDGQRLRIKYGSVEWKGEVAATRLLSALGFGADDVTGMRRVRCYGCPRWPYETRQVSERLHLQRLFDDRIDYSQFTDFESVSVERRGRWRELEFGDQQGWGFDELSAIDPAAGGASRAEVDALRLIAVFLNHWDNKPSNQRLVCLDERCDHPLAMIQDAGSTFGPKKVDLDGWRDSPVWADGPRCRVTMRHLPYGGGTFEDAEISEEGRRLLAARLRQLEGAAVRDVFSRASFDEPDAWAAAFNRRVEAIERRPPCPS